MGPIFIVVAVLVLLLDQWSKHLILTRLRPGELIGMGIFDIHHVHNTGAAFGIMPSSSHLFISIALIVLTLVTVSYSRIRQADVLTVISIAMISGGTLGNLIDRMRLGYVVDFIDFRWWPVFNIADSAICVGVAILALRLMKSPDSRLETAPGAEAPPTAETAATTETGGAEPALEPALAEPAPPAEAATPRSPASMPPERLLAPTAPVPIDDILREGGH